MLICIVLKQLFLLKLLNYTENATESFYFSVPVVSKEILNYRNYILACTIQCLASGHLMVSLLILCRRN